MISGGITFGDGSFQMIDTAGLTVGRNDQQSQNLFAFDEEQNYKVATDLTLDTGGVIKAGTVVSSQYVFFDPKRSSRQQGFVDFDSQILGIATSLGSLAMTDFLGLDPVTYRTPRLRGLERDDEAIIDASLANRLLVDWRASSPGDYIRVLTLGSETPLEPIAAVPLPASGFGLLAAFAALAMMRRRKTV